MIVSSKFKKTQIDLTRIFKSEPIPEPLTYLNHLVEAVLRVTEYYCNWQARYINFQYAVFISINTNRSTIERKLRRLFPLPTNKLLVNNFKRIIILNYKDRVLSPNRLYDILFTLQLLALAVKIGNQATS